MDLRYPLLQRISIIVLTIILNTGGIYSQPPEGRFIIDVLEYDNDLDEPTQFDLHILRQDSAYKVTIFLMYQDTLRAYNTLLEIEGDYNKAEYEWISKNRAAVTLFNPETQSEFRMKIWGKGTCSTGTEILD